MLKTKILALPYADFSQYCHIALVGNSPGKHGDKGERCNELERPGKRGIALSSYGGFKIYINSNLNTKFLWDSHVTYRLSTLPPYEAIFQMSNIARYFTSYDSECCVNMLFWPAIIYLNSDSDLNSLYRETIQVTEFLNLNLRFIL